MSSIKSKKKSDSGKIPKPINIKAEDDHIMYPMEHYVDDRVELIRQIFASLKSKTITNLAPEFLKKTKLEDIQEQCLNEILGISKKRLLSIINSSKCPTDTESSSEDDVNSIEEHISLEEISSDSDIVEHKSSKAGKRDGKKKQKVKNETGNENNKKFSVLELLELQARARAIRSQLALEPVTKIEVDTDSDDSKAPSKKPTPSRTKSDKPTNGNVTSSKSCATKRSKTTFTVTLTNSNGDPAVSAPLKRIKLKRNFRKQTMDDNSNDESKNSEKMSTSTERSEPKKETRSPSPDVIPIISIPETLCISDSDDEKEASQNLATSKSNESSKQIEILSVVNIKAREKLDDSTESTVLKNKSNDSPEEVKPIEAEEGEICEEEERPKEDSPTEDITEVNASEPVSKDVPKDQKDKTVPEEPTEFPTETKDQTSSDVSEHKMIPEASDTKLEKVVECSESEDDANDDVISLEGGDLLNEMREHLEEDVKESKETESTEQVICLDDSSEEETINKKKTESWNERWLKSSKVSKVMAASRLGNRVRNKIKLSNKAKKLEVAAVAESEQTKPQEVIFTSLHEDGSVEQYKELLDNIQKKTD